MENNFNFFKSQDDLEKFLCTSKIEDLKIMGLNLIGASDSIVYKPDFGEYGTPTLLGCSYSKGVFNFYINIAVLGDINISHILEASKNRMGLYHYLKDNRLPRGDISKINIAFIGTGIDQDICYMPFMSDSTGMMFYLFDNKDDDLMFFMQYQTKISEDCFPSTLNSSMNSLISSSLNKKNNG